MRRGLPTKEHEDKIDEFCNDGFKRFGFCAWFKSVGIWSSLGVSSALPIFDFDSGFLAFTDGLPNARKMKTKRTIARLQSFIPDFIDYDCGEEINLDQYNNLTDEEKECFEEPYIGVGGAYCLLGESCISPKNLSLITDRLAVIPDCWTYRHDEKIVEIIEVTDRCHLTYRRLKKYAAIADLLFQWANIRVILKEFQLKGGVITHNLNLVYDLSLDVGDMYGEPEDENEALKWYFKKKGA